MTAHITFDETKLRPGEYVVISWPDFAGLMQGDEDLRPKSVPFMKFTVPAEPLPDVGHEDDE